MALMYFCDKCGVETDKNVKHIKLDLCPKCSKEFKKWLGNKEGK